MTCPSEKLKMEPTDSSIDYNWVPGKTLIMCPYNNSHELLPFKYTTHVLRCYRVHCKEQAAKNEKPSFAICQYDRSHHVRKEELECHESVCSKRFLNDE